MHLSSTHKKHSSKRNSLSSKKPTYKQVAVAINYWGQIREMTQFFQNAEMNEVSRHMMAACEEIDRIWTEGDYELCESGKGVSHGK